MPEWGEKPEKALEDSLHTVLEGLEDEIADNPSFQAVTGIPLDKMTQHASEAIKAVFGKRQGIDLDVLVQCYAMGFVIGMKFAAYQKEHAGGNE